VPVENFKEKSKHAARFRQNSTLTADTALIDCAAVYLTPCSTVLPEQLMVCKLVEKFATFYERRRFIAVFTRPICPYPEPGQSSTRPPITLNSMIYGKKNQDQTEFREILLPFSSVQNLFVIPSADYKRK